MKSQIKKYLAALPDLHSDKSRKTVILAGVVVIAGLAVLVRGSMISAQNVDYQIISSWYDFAKEHGMGVLKYGFDDGFSNYNPPFSYFLVVCTWLPISKILAIKGMMAFFDVILALSVYLLASLFRRSKKFALSISLITMFLPTVLLNGVYWGQFDQLYVALTIFSLWAGLRGRSKWAWAFLGLALSIKFQAVFFLPAFGILVFKKIKWQDFIYGLGAFLAVTLPPALFGRPLIELLKIYPDQAKLFHGQLTLNAPNIYQLLPNASYDHFNMAGIALGLAAALSIFIYALHYKKFSNQELLLASTLMLFVVPFILPAMHERYFFPASVFSLLLAFIYPKAKYVWIAVGAQVITIFSYAPFLFGVAPPIPFGVLSLGNLVIIVSLVCEYLLIEGKTLTVRRNR